MTDKQTAAIFAAYVDLDYLVQEYRTAVLWLTHGNHKATPRPTEQQTRKLIKELKEKIIALLNEIESKTQF